MIACCPVGTVQVAAISEVPTRTWIMSGAGHAPETLEVNELEYATQIPEFFKSAFAGTLTIPKATLEVQSRGGKWFATVSLECKVPGAWQIAIGSQDGRFVFARRMVKDQIKVTVECDFEPTHVSAIRFHHVEPQPDGTWLPQLTALSQSLAAFRRFERQVDENCKWIDSSISIRNRAIHDTASRSPGNGVAVVQPAEASGCAFRRPNALWSNIVSVLLLARSGWAAEMPGLVARDMEFSP